MQLGRADTLRAAVNAFLGCVPYYRRILFLKNNCTIEILILHT